jgi:hypothetical protein
VKIRELITHYEEASGARINIQKLKVIALGRWDKNIKPMGIVFHDNITILGIIFQNNAMGSAKVSWERVTATIRGQASEAYSRELNFEQRVDFIQDCLLARV